MRKIIYFLALLPALSVSIAACAQGKDSKEENKMKENKRVLVTYFSRTGENYGLGNITEGNTQIVAGMIAGETGGELFRIVPAVAYPDSYDACVDLAKRELNAGARPVVKGDVKTEDYDVIFVGYPNWWGDMPMCVYTFLEKHDWRGKTVVPFCTHEGSGLGNTARNLQTVCKGATVLKGLALYGHTAQNDREEAAKAVEKWLKSLQY